MCIFNFKMYAPVAYAAHVLGPPGAIATSRHCELPVWVLGTRLHWRSRKCSDY